MEVKTQTPEIKFYRTKIGLGEAVDFFNDLSKQLKTLLNQSLIDEVKGLYDFEKGNLSWKLDETYYFKFTNLSAEEIKILKEVFPGAFSDLAENKIVVGGNELTKPKNVLPLPSSQRSKLFTGLFLPTVIQLPEFDENHILEIVDSLKDPNYVTIAKTLLFLFSNQ